MKGIKSSAHALLGEDVLLADLFTHPYHRGRKSSKLFAVHEKTGVALDLSGCRGRGLTRINHQR